MMKLYHVTTTVPEFHGHRNVNFWWLVNERTVRATRQYRELIEGYGNPTHAYPQGAIDEMFDQAEVDRFATWLKANRADLAGGLEIVEEKLPIPLNSLGLSYLPLGGPTDLLGPPEFRDGPIPALGFSVYGYYDLEQCELTDEAERIAARMRLARQEVGCGAQTKQW